MRPPRSSSRADQLTRALHLAALCGLAIAQPLYDLIGRHASFLIAHGAGPGAILAIAAGLSLGVPLALTLIVEAVNLVSARGARWLQIALVALLGAALAAIALRGQPTVVALTGSAVAGAVLGAAYRARTVRLFLTILSPAALLFPLLFLTTTPAGRLLWPARHGLESESAAKRTNPIVMVVFDELGSLETIGPDGRLDAARFPHLAGLAETSTWFPNAIGADPFTGRAVPSLVTGVAPGPSRDLIPYAADHPRNLFTWLAGTHEIRVEEPFTQLCPREICPEARRLSPAALTRDIVVLYLHLTVPADMASAHLPPLGLGWAGFDRHDASGATPGAFDGVEAFARSLDRGRAGLFREFVASIDGPARPVFYFVHTLLPHNPYRYRRSGLAYTGKALPDGLADTGEWPDDPWVVENVRERHLEQARFADALLGQLIDRLQRERLFDDALIVVTSDHGSAFVPGDMHRAPTPTNYVEVAAVPLLIKRPGQVSGTIDPRPVSGIDIAPTIADVLGTTLPWPHDGSSAFGGTFPERPSVIYEGYDLPPMPRFDARAEAARRAAIPRVREAYDTLLGQRASTFARAAAPREWRLFSSAVDDVQDVRPGSGFVPSFVRGRVEGAGREPLMIALAIDGTIRAVTRTFGWRGATHHFAVLLPESAVGRGAHHLEAFVVHGAAGAWRLTPVSSDLTAQLELLAEGDVEYLVTASGGRLPIQRRPAGQLDRIEIGDEIALHGWATGPDGQSPARSVVAMAGGRNLATAAPGDERPDVSAALALPPGTRTTFALAFAREPLASGLRLRLFAVGDESAAEITIPQNLAAQLAAIQRE